MGGHQRKLSTSEFLHMHFYLHTLIHPIVGLQDLTMTFAKEEIDSIVANLPNGKSLG
jgi:hypothetical protein